MFESFDRHLEKAVSRLRFTMRYWEPSFNCTLVIVQVTYLICCGKFKSSISSWEPTPKLLGGYICSILHSDVLLDGAHQAPELFLHQLCWNHLKQRIQGKAHVQFHLPLVRVVHTLQWNNKFISKHIY